MLVPGQEDGVAVRAGLYAAQGTIIGKALSSTAFDEGMRTGTVDMLVTLG